MKKTRAEWQAEQERLLAVYPDASETLRRIPGVVEVGVGLRHRAGALVEEGVFVVFVERKRPLDEVPADERIPATFRGFPVDVEPKRLDIPLLGFGDERDRKNYKTKVGGIAIGSDGSKGSGTLGCFCSIDNSTAIAVLSCHHVLYDGDAKDGSGVGQPMYDYSCCCTCNEIAKNTKGDKNVDCAYATLKDKVAFFPKIKRIKRGDGTVEDEGLINGTSTAVMSQVVHKVGFKTGLTRGTVSLVTPRVEVDRDPTFARFCDRGDSGSVIIETATRNVIALLRAMPDDTGVQGLAVPIGTVEAVLKIKVLKSDPTATYTERHTDEDEDEELFPLPATSPFEALVERLRNSEAGRDVLALFDRHRSECLNIVNARRGFTVTWHRHKGPAWLAALGRSAREPIYEIPTEIENVARAEAVCAIDDALSLEASDTLRRDLDAIREALAPVLATAHTVDDALAMLETSGSRT
jgi:hypothetical protein